MSHNPYAKLLMSESESESEPIFESSVESATHSSSLDEKRNRDDDKKKEEKMEEKHDVVSNDVVQNFDTLLPKNIFNTNL